LIAAVSLDPGDQSLRLEHPRQSHNPLWSLDRLRRDQSGTVLDNLAFLLVLLYLSPNISRIDQSNNTSGSASSRRPQFPLSEASVGGLLRRTQLVQLDSRREQSHHATLCQLRVYREKMAVVERRRESPSSHWTLVENDTIQLSP
jgi:hypothetical protein